jgi:hypothetical protein
MQETIDTIVKDLTFPVRIERRNKQGRKEFISTVFDNAFISLQLYKITRNPIYLERVIPYLYERAEEAGSSKRWSFPAPRNLPDLPPFPPDADTTALALLIFAYAEKEGIDIPDKYSPQNNLTQFQELISGEGYLNSWFARQQPLADPDPVVHTTVALLYVTLGTGDHAAQVTQRYLNNYAQNIAQHPKGTPYFPSGRIFTAGRLAEITMQQSDYLSGEAQASLDVFIESEMPTSCLEAAWLSIAASHRNKPTVTARSNQYLQQQRQVNGLWSWEPFYNQKEHWLYGHEVITTLVAFKALQLAKYK